MSKRDKILEQFEGIANDIADTLPYYVLDMDKNPVRCCDFMSWKKWMERNREVKTTDIGEIIVKTIFTGIDFHAGQKEHIPVLFKTYVIGGSYDCHVIDDCMWPDAMITHDEVCKMVRPFYKRLMDKFLKRR